MGRTACTYPQCLYSMAIHLLPLCAVRSVQNLGAFRRVHFNLTFTLFLLNLLPKATFFTGFFQGFLLFAQIKEGNFVAFFVRSVIELKINAKVLIFLTFSRRTHPILLNRYLTNAPNGCAAAI